VKDEPSAASSYSHSPRRLGAADVAHRQQLTIPTATL
jgi:hypothetical protein